MSIPTVSELLLEQAIREAKEKPNPAVAMGVDTRELHLIPFCKLVYCYEDKIDETGRRSSPHF